MPGFCRSKVIGGDALRTPISNAVKSVICQCVDRRFFAVFLWTFPWKCVVLKSNWSCAQRQRKLLEARFWVSLAYRVMPRLRPASRMLATPPHNIISRSLSHFDILPGLQPLCLVINTLAAVLQQRVPYEQRLHASLCAPNFLNLPSFLMFWSDMIISLFTNLKPWVLVGKAVNYPCL